MKTVENMFKSVDARIKNANKHKLSSGARQVYLHGLARLSLAEEVASRGNRGRGFKAAFLFPEPRAEKQEKQTKY